MDVFIIITPVYWGEMSEPAKTFTDKLRRCETTKKDTNYLEGKPLVLVAAAGGSDGGTLTCLSSMELFTWHVREYVFDYIAITRKSREHKLETIHAASRRMVKSIK